MKDDYLNIEPSNKYENNNKKSSSIMQLVIVIVACAVLGYFAVSILLALLGMLLQFAIPVALVALVVWIIVKYTKK